MRAHSKAEDSGSREGFLRSQPGDSGDGCWGLVSSRGRGHG